MADRARRSLPMPASLRSVASLRRTASLQGPAVRGAGSLTRRLASRLRPGPEGAQTNRRGVIAPLLVGGLVLVSSVAGVGAASGAEGVAASLAAGPRLTITGPVLGDARMAEGPGLIAGPATPSPSAESGVDGLVFVPVLVDATPSPSVPASPTPAPSAKAAPAVARASVAAPLPVVAPPSRFAPLLWPVPGGTLSQGFGCTGVVWEPAYGNCPHYHNGLDIAAPQGTPILAAAAGTVVFAGWQSNGGGLQVWVSDGGNMYTGYHHMASAAVHAGQRISRGQRIGAVGMTGDATGPHLHFMVGIGPFWANGTAVDPRRYM